MLQTKLEKLVSTLKEENLIPPETYKKYNVKRGLRDIHGKGVLVGLTRISEVHGYLVDEAEKVPDEGRLLYRGIDIFDIVRGFQKDGRFGFEEVAYLILFGNLPKREELEWFQRYMAEKRFLRKGFTEDYILKNASHNIMNALQRAILNLYVFDAEADVVTLDNVLFQSLDLIAKMPILMAYAYQAKKHHYEKRSFHLYPPKVEYSAAENLLYMMRSDGQFTHKEAEILDLALVLHAEHGGGNNSSFTNYVISSSGTDTYSAMAASVGSLKGPLHGGANKKVLDMIAYIVETIGENPTDGAIRDCLLAILRKEAFDKKGLIYGMGHAVYTLSDPRAVLFREKAFELAEEKNVLEAYNLLHRIEMIATEVFKELKGDDFAICANVDFYSGFIYTMLGIPNDLFTPLFAVSRMVGWCAHRLEQIVSDPRIIRPAYKSIYGDKQYTSIYDR